MKIQQLHINRFGHFSDCDLELTGNGFHVIYGPNEAGKTTLLQFLRGLLFDFPMKTAYDFGGSGDLSGIGMLTLADGRNVELRRRKGLKNKIAVKLDGQPTEIDDTGLRRLLGHADRDLYESVFAFGLEQLSQGELSLKHENLQSALFGGSLGGNTSPDRILTELDRQAGELFKSGKATKPAMNALLEELKQTSKQIKEKSLKSDEYRQREQAAVQATEVASRLHEEVDALRREYSRVDQLIRAWPKWWDWKQRTVERSQLQLPSTLAPDALQRFTSVTDKLLSATDERESLLQEITAIEHELAALKLDPEAVDYRTEIKLCLELKQSVLEARRDLPERQRHRDGLRRQIDGELAELRPGWTHSDLSAFSIDVATRTEIDHWDHEQRERATLRTKLTTKRDAETENLERAKNELEHCGTPVDVAPLIAVIGDEQSYATSLQQRDSSERELAKIERKLATQLRKLTPPLPPESESPQKLPIPRRETIAQFASQFAAQSEEIRIATDSLLEDEDERQSLESQWSELSSGRIVPTLEQREDARRRRDDGWKLIRRKYIDGTPAPAATKSWIGDAGGTVEDVYEQTVRDADYLADQIYENADAVARREALRRQIDILTTRISQKQIRLTELKLQLENREKEWADLWTPCEFKPLSPEAMLRWMDDHESVCETCSAKEEVSQNISCVNGRIKEYEDRLRNVCASSPLCRADNEPPSVLLAACRLAIEDARNQQRRSAESQKEAKRLAVQLVKFETELKRLNEQDDAARSEWQLLLKRLNLPSDWEPSLTRSVIEQLTATRVKLDSLPNEESRISAMQSRIDEFDNRLRDLCQAVGPDLLREPPELAIEKLAEQLERAVEANRRHDQLAAKRKSCRDSLQRLEERIVRHEKERADLYSAAEVETESDFLTAARHAEKITKLDNDIELLAREIHGIRAGEDEAEFERSLSEVDKEVLVGRHRDLKERLQSQEQLKREADEKVGATRRELAQLDGSGDVALLMDERSRKRSLLAAEVDRYVPIVLARNLLSEAVRRFERENQPEMIATVSQLLTKMSAGRYVEFDRTGGDTQGLIVRRCDGVERTPDQLSTGTREQLYLAIRLAYVLHYCRQNEPLPIVMDDVLVNFDDARTKQTLSTLIELSQTVQILFFTCHPHMVALAQSVHSHLKPIEIPASHL